MTKISRDDIKKKGIKRFHERKETYQDFGTERLMESIVLQRQ